MLVSCRFGYNWISTLPGLHKAMEFHNYKISLRSRVHTPGYTLCIPSHKPLPYTPIMHHSPCLPDIQTSLFQAGLHVINPPLLQPTHCAATSTFSYINPLSITVILPPFHMAEPSDNTFINLFIYILHHPT